MTPKYGVLTERCKHDNVAFCRERELPLILLLSIFFTAPRLEQKLVFPPSRCQLADRIFFVAFVSYLPRLESKKGFQIQAECLPDLEPFYLKRFCLPIILVNGTPCFIALLEPLFLYSL